MVCGRMLEASYHVHDHFWDLHPGSVYCNVSWQACNNTVKHRLSLGRWMWVSLVFIHSKSGLGSLPKFSSTPKKIVGAHLPCASACALYCPPLGPVPLKPCSPRY